MKNKLKIGIVCYPTYGGSGVVATELGIALAEKGNEVHFISYDQPFRLDLYSDRIYYHEVSVPDYPLFDFTPYELNLTSKLVDVVLHENLNILHVHYAIPHASAAVNAKQILATHGINIPIVTTLHGTDITLLGKDKSFKPVIEYAINMSDAVTAVSQDLKKETLEHFNITNEIKTIPNFIDMSMYQQEADKQLRKNIDYSENESLFKEVCSGVANSATLMIAKSLEFLKAFFATVVFGSKSLNFSKTTFVGWPRTRIRAPANTNRFLD